MSMIRGPSDVQPSTTPRLAIDDKSIYSEIVALNNRGSLLLSAGNLKAASASFSRALQALKKTTPVPSSRSCATEGDTAKSLVRLAPKIEFFFSNRQQQGGGHACIDNWGQSPSLLSIMHPSSYSAWSLPLSGGGGDFIHDRPIELYQHPQVVDSGGEHHHGEDEPTSMTMNHVFQSVSFCAIYNLALSCHLRAKGLMQAEEGPRRHGQDQTRPVLATEEETRRKLQTTLQQAAQLYAHAHVLLTQCCVQEDYCILYDLAIFNNHGHVLYKLDRVAEGRRNFQVLFQSIILRITTPCGRYGGWSPLSSHVHTENHHYRIQQFLLDGILSNVLFYLMGSCKNAPAA